MRRLLSNQNEKLGRLSSFSLPLCSCDKTMNKECKKYCYANYMKRLYPSWQKKMMYNYKVAKSKDFVARINYELKESSLYVRIHVSGDFFSQEYLDKWQNIARLNPHYTFYCYTKCIRLDFSYRPKNFIVFLSDDQLKLQRHWHRFDGIATISFPVVVKGKNTFPKIDGFTLCRHQSEKINCAYCGLCMKPGSKIYFNKH
jgi:hypothetical protein